MEVELFEGIEPDPSVETVMKGAAAMEKFQPDWIVAIGGGSPIDAAKAMWIKYEYPEITFEDMCKVFGIPKLRRKAHFCAISSTSGTATEVTAFSIITDYAKGIKYPIADFEITPDVAIVDPELADTMPKKLVAHTGMDAMTHAIEAYVSTANCNLHRSAGPHRHQDDPDRPDSVATTAIWKNATQCTTHSAWPVWRSPTHFSASFTPWLTRPVLPSPITALISSMVQQTPCICRRSSHLTQKTRPPRARYGVIADKMNLGGANDDEKVALLIKYLRGMNDDLNIPHCIGHYGPDSYPCEQGFVPENVFLERLPEIAKNAIADACTGSNPRQPSQEEMEKLLKCCYYDTEVDF